VADIVVSAEAERDLEDIEQYSFERFGDTVGADYMQGFGDVFTRLTEYPAIGEIVPGLRPPVRSVIHRSHRIVYDFDGYRVAVVRILHNAMNVAKALRN
jgi:toxin ParE1/3/4